MQADFRLGDWLVQPALGRASRDGQTIHLRAKVMDLLVCLARRPGQVVSKDDILGEVWKTEFISESALTRVVADLRQAFGDDVDHPAVIETIAKRGYRLMPPVVPISAGDGTLDQPPESTAAPTIVASQPVPIVARPKRRMIILAASFSLALAVIAVAFWRRPAAPIVTDQDTVLLADFTNRTDDAAFDYVLREALAVQLAQSPFLSLVPQERIRETLRLMERSPETPVADAVAREVCERERAKVMIAGSITPVGQRYVVGLDAVACRTGDTVSRALEEAADKEHVLGSLGTAASAMRRHLGESLSSIQRFDVPIQRSTTSSLEALKAYSLAFQELNRGAGHETAAIRLFEHAIELDPQFFGAYLNVSIIHSNLEDEQVALEYLHKAWELRHRVTERERLAIEAIRSLNETFNYEEGIETYRLLQRLYPRSAGIYNNVTIMYKAVGLHEQALEAARENRSRNPNSAFAFLQLGRAYLCLGRFDEAKQVLDEARSRGLENVDILTELYEIAFQRRDATAMEQYIFRAEGTPLESRLTAIRAQAASSLGQQQRAEQLSERIIRVANLTDQTREVVSAAFRSTLLGNTADRRVGKLEEAVAAVHDADRWPTFAVAATTLALAGDVTGASRIADTLTERFPVATPVKRKWLPTIAAARAIHNRDFTGAISSLDHMGSYEFGRAIRGVDRYAVLAPTYLRAQAYLGLGQTSAAAAEFKKILDRPGLGPTSPILPLARLGLARAYAKAGDAAGGRKAYDELLTFWKDADPDLPVLVEARGEYAKLLEFQGRR
jgi:DNA-binding winged helix-turn-helix (wHTH) protein/tetratricopeptide (TPR) repeat protein